MEVQVLSWAQMEVDSYRLKNNPLTHQHPLADASLWALIVSNLVTLFLAVSQNWSLHTTLWIFWFQSLTIGLFNFIRILQLDDFSTEGLMINGQAVEPTPQTKLYVAGFFAIHFGFFHLVYLAFLASGLFTQSPSEITNPAVVKSGPIIFAAAIFFVNHLFSYLFNRPRDTKRQNIGTLLFYPYLRIIPMHIIIIFGLFVGQYALSAFLILKTLADVGMHLIEHNIIRKGEA